MPGRGRPRSAATEFYQRAGVWYVRFVDPDTGRRCRRSTGHRDRAAAEREQATFILGRSAPRQADPTAVRVGWCLARYLTKISDRPSAPAALIAVERYLGPTFGALLVSELTPDRQRAFRDNLLAAGKAESYISRTLSVLSAALHYAVKMQWLERAPQILGITASPARTRWLTQDECARLLEAATGETRLFVALALGTGLRPRAILDLSWQQIDLTAKVIHAAASIPQSPVDSPRIAHGKKRPSVPIPDALGAALREIRRDRGPLFSVASVKRSFRTACARAELVGVTPYTLRHTFATLALRAGCSPWEVAGALGHVDLRMVTAHYGHHSVDHLRATVEAVAGEFRYNFGTETAAAAANLVGAAGIEPATPTMSTSDHAVNVLDFKALTRRGKRERTEK